MRFKNICLMAMMLLGFCAAGDLRAQEVFYKSYGSAMRRTSALIETRDGYLSIFRSGGGFSDTTQRKGLSVLKTGLTGEVQWQKIIQYRYDLELTPTDVIQTRDGGFCISGRQENTQFGWTEIYGILLKTDSLGNLQWLKSYSDGKAGSEVFNMWFTRIEEQPNGDIMLMGRGSSYCYFTSVDSSGELLWSKRFYPFTGWSDLQKDKNGDLISTGNYGLLKLDPTGNLLWSKSYGQFINGVDVTDGGGYIMSGSFENKLHVIKTNDSGAVQWARYYTMESSTPIESSVSIRKLKNGNYFIAGLLKTCADCNPPWYIVMDSIGRVTTAKMPGTLYTYIHSPIGTRDAGFAFSGYVSSNAAQNSETILLKADSAGNLNCSEKILTTFSQSFEPEVADTPAIFETRSITMKELIVDQVSLENISVKDLCSTVGVSYDTHERFFTISPNPISQYCTILLKETVQTADISIIDLTGKTLYRTFLKNPGQKIPLDISPLLKGIYFVKVNADGREFLQKLVVE